MTLSLPKGNRGLRSRAVKGGFKNFLAPQAAHNEVERVKKLPATARATKFGDRKAKQPYRGLNADKRGSENTPYASPKRPNTLSLGSLSLGNALIPRK
jgi:hypothetical protein